MLHTIKQFIKSSRLINDLKLTCVSTSILGLVRGSTYEFRIVPWIIKNRGKPSLPTAPTVAENPYGEYRGI